MEFNGKEKTIDEQARGTVGRDCSIAKNQQKREKRERESNILTF
jgi:hypothetical protein